MTTRRWRGGRTIGVTTEVDVDISLEDIDTEDLEEELESRYQESSRKSRHSQPEMSTPGIAIGQLRRAGCPRHLLASLEEWAEGLGRKVIPGDLAHWKEWVSKVEEV
ncbi:MAG: hypothetical protein U1B30_15805 [Pseudomonadota bacterium]|nr:hypothetical protein [Pseudomonadota bacterium]